MRSQQNNKNSTTNKNGNIYDEKMGKITFLN